MNGSTKKVRGEWYHDWMHMLLRILCLYGYWNGQLHRGAFVLHVSLIFVQLTYTSITCISRSLPTIHLVYCQCHPSSHFTSHSPVIEVFYNYFFHIDIVVLLLIIIIDFILPPLICKFKEMTFRSSDASFKSSKQNRRIWSMNESQRYFPPSQSFNWKWCKSDFKFKWWSYYLSEHK